MGKDMYRVTMQVSDLGWVDLIIIVPLAGGLLLSATCFPDKMGNIPNISQPNPGPRPAWSPCTPYQSKKVAVNINSG